MSFAVDFVILREAKELNCRLENIEKSYELKLIKKWRIENWLDFRGESLRNTLYEIRITKYKL